MTFHIVIITAIFKIWEEENERKERTRRKGGATRVKKKDDDSIACQVSVGSGGFFLSVSNNVITLYKFIYSFSLSTHAYVTRCKKESRRHWDRHYIKIQNHQTFARFNYVNQTYHYFLYIIGIFQSWLLLNQNVRLALWNLLNIWNNQFYLLDFWLLDTL